MKNFILLFFLASCTLFHKGPTLGNLDKEKLLDSIRLTGEGKGRLKLGLSSYIFSVDSVLNQNIDWIFAVSIPLHGEEVMILPDLKQHSMPAMEMSSFEHRIKNEFYRLKIDSDIGPKLFMNELRSLIRFNLGNSWGQKRDCQKKQTELICMLDEEKFIIYIKNEEIIINKYFGDNTIQLVAENLTDSFFRKTSILLFTNTLDLQKKNPSFSLELFW